MEEAKYEIRREVLLTTIKTRKKQQQQHLHEELYI